MLRFQDSKEILRRLLGRKCIIGVRVNSVILCNVKGHAPITLAPRLLNTKITGSGINDNETVYKEFAYS